ncbi:MAG: hypothetical protein K8L97_31240 [Anaerolineae bacterium]|nr:hypothetical protein [Anaerolineae bacterium]
MQISVELDPNRRKALWNGFVACDICVAELNIREHLFMPYEQFHRYCGARESLVEDFLFVSSVCFGVDLLVGRESAADNWTRELSVEIPVRDVDLWNNQATLLGEILRFLTGDRWTLSFNKRVVPLYIKRINRRRVRRYAADTVCLFSGGLDSFLGALDCLSTSTGHVALVGHYDAGLARTSQLELFQEIRNTFGRWRTHLFQARIGFQPVERTEAVDFGESTQRSRSLVFIALGVYIAHQQGKDRNVPVLIPENGFIALNPPLTYSRLGSCSTRTVHPYFLEKLQLFINNVGINTQLSNPFAGQSKGEMLNSSPQSELAKSLAHLSVSCAHPTRRQNWIRRAAKHCGYCVPCLVRRASMHAAGIDDGLQYGIDVMAGELDIYEEVGADFRAILNLLSNWNSDSQYVRKLVNRMSIPDGQYEQATTVIGKQLEEFHELVNSKATREIRQWAGLT